MYTETLRGPRGLTWLGITAAVIAAGSEGLIIGSLGSLWGNPAFPVLVAAGIWLLLILGLASAVGILNRTTVCVSEGEIRGYLSPLRVVRIPVTSIVAMQEVTVSPRAAGGIGYRLKLGHRFLLLSGGPAVTLTVQNRPAYTLRSERPAELMSGIGREARRVR
ncbi:hypothetical protein [Mycetocola saprophilus]|uniref:hypothetical protein n=1 Tax=Mycetocola saprophilus TaxID=76636 RepID=UPI003BF446A2